LSNASEEQLEYLYTLNRPIEPNTEGRPLMDIPPVTVTPTQLRRNNGDRGTPKWIAYEGIVYDVSDCARWRGEMHENLHFPGQDLTSEFPDAPHTEIVFRNPCAKVIGRLAQE
jgi:predicted heme/steroid binding protein